MNCSSLGFTKPLDLTNGGQPFQQLSGDLETKLLSGESSVSESNVTSVKDRFLNKPTAHNRTARDAGHMCFLKIERMWDHCRGKFVKRVYCKTEHVACFQAILKYNKPLCQTVYGYRQMKYSSNCPSLPIDCQCAA